MYIFPGKKGPEGGRGVSLNNGPLEQKRGGILVSKARFRVGSSRHQGGRDAVAAQSGGDPQRPCAVLICSVRARPLFTDPEEGATLKYQPWCQALFFLGYPKKP